MKHGRGIEGLDDKSSGIEILMSEEVRGGGRLYIYYESTKRESKIFLLL